MQEVEERDDHETGYPTHEGSSKRNDFLILLVIALEGGEMVRTEVELIPVTVVPVPVHLIAHIGAARHQVAIFISLRHELERKVTGCELILGTHYGREELLMESEPAELAVYLLLTAPAAAYDLRLLFT